MPCGPICPASDALCIAGFKQASACQPPTREIRCIGSGIVDSVEQDLHIVYTYINIGVFRRLGSFFLRKLGPNFQNTGLEIEPRFPAKPLCRKFGPRVGGIEPATFRLQACAPPTRPSAGGQQGHTSSFATWPSPQAPARPKPKSKIQTPNGPFGFWSLEFGFWILDLGFWILDFGSWILDFGFWISLVFVLFVAAPNGPVWILGFGVWIWDFGFWILGLSTPFGSCIRYFLVTPTRVGGFPYMYHKNQPNVGKYTMHGSYGLEQGFCFFS